MVVNLTAIGTLAIMAVVNLAVMVLRRRNPELPRSFRVPLFPLSPILGIGFCLYLIWGTGWTTWLQFAGFLVAGTLVYAFYGRSRSRLVTASDGAGPVSPGA